MGDFWGRWFRQLDWTLLISLLLLAIFSCLALFSTANGKTGSNVPTHIVSKQILFEVLGFITMLLTAKFDYRTLQKRSRWIYGITIFLLVVVFVMPSRFGAHSWIPLGLFALQPSEFAKLALIIVVGAYMSSTDQSESPSYGWKKILSILGMFIVPFVLTLKEPALGQALVMFIIVIVMYMVFAKRAHMAALVTGLVVVVSGFSYVALNFSKQSTVFIQNVLIKHHILKSYQADRIIVWLNPSFDPSSAGYNVHQAQVAIGSGQVFGEGFLNGIETHGGWIPNQWTDFIFTAIAEQFGFVGSALLVLVFLVLIHRLIRIAAKSLDPFGTYLIIGIVGMFAFQVFENIGMDMYLSPATGITLPFISYGGSSLIANYMAVGLALSVYNRCKSMRYSSLNSTPYGISV